MFYFASASKQNLNTWLKWVNNAPKNIFWCGGGAVCNDCPTKLPTITPTKSPTITPSMAHPTAPTENENNCDDKSKRECKKFKDACIFGKSKLFGECKPQKLGDIHRCTGYDDEVSCTDDENHGGLYGFNNDGCSHACNDLVQKYCKKLQESM